MKRLIIAALLLTVGPIAYAQKAPVPPTPNPVVALPDPLHLTISRANLQLIGRGLMELPYKDAAPALNELQKQLNDADQKAKDDASKPSTPPADPPKK